jgi:5,10-methylenetetrahydrofolate reductase
MGSIKVKEVNIEQGYPNVESALRDMISQLGTYKRMGFRAILLVHGYGSSGTGGKIKTSVRMKLKESSLIGLVKMSCGGEDWIDGKKRSLDLCPELKDYERRISGNPGVTVVILR